MSSSKVFRDVCVVSVTLKYRSMICCCVLAISYNIPRLSPCASWNADAITYVNNSIGIYPTGILVTVDDTVYVAMSNLNQIQVWTEENSIPMMNHSIITSEPHDVFVTINRDVYFGGGNLQDIVDKWIWNTNVSVPAMHTSGICFGLFVDVIDNLYCSLDLANQVMRISTNCVINNTVIVAGNSMNGSAPNMLHGPRGIFVDTDFVLYVADCYNNRIQRFLYGQSNGLTVAGSGAMGSISLSLPHDVILDGNGYIYIVEFYGHRIVCSGPYGFRCIIGCTGTAGSAANQLSNPTGLSFDNHGNLFVTDSANSRVQKFLLSNTSCGE